MNPSRLTPEQAILRTLEDLDDLKTWPGDWDGYNVDPPNPFHVDFAKVWILGGFFNLKAHWLRYRQPHVSADEEGDPCFEWRSPTGREGLTMYFESEDHLFSVWYIKSWGSHMSLQMEDGVVEMKDFHFLWEDFVSGYQEDHPSRRLVRHPGWG